MMHTKIQKWLLIMSCTLALSACGGDRESIEDWMSKAGKDLHGKIEPIPALEPFQPYPFKSGALGSPFDVTRLNVARSKPKGMLDTNRPREFLENFELAQLKLTGTMLINKQRYALIRIPDGSIYRVQPGSFIGPDFGIVRRVSETELSLEETIENINGEWVQRMNTLHLLQQEQGTKP